jgi:hypothetical protein
MIEQAPSLAVGNTLDLEEQDNTTYTSTFWCCLLLSQRISFPSLREGGFDGCGISVEARRISPVLGKVSACLFHEFSDTFQLGVAEAEVSGFPILLTVLNLLAPRDDNDVVSLGDQPRYAHLGRGGFVGNGNSLQIFDDLEDRGEVLCSESRNPAAEVIVREVVGRFLTGCSASDKLDTQWGARETGTQRICLWPTLDR